MPPKLNPKCVNKMAKKKNNHLIKKQIINIRTNNPKTVKEVQQRILRVYKFKIAPRLDQILSRLVPADVFITLDKLTINLDRITVSNLESDFARQAEKKIKAAIVEALQKQGVNIKNKGGNLPENIQQKVVSKREILQTFISEGRYPSWASGENANAQIIMAELLEENPKTVQTMLVRLAKRPEVQKRLFMQFDAEVIDKLIATLYGADYKLVKAQLLFIQKRIQRQYPASSRKRVEKLVQEAALDFYVKNTTRARKFKYKEREFNLAIIEKVQEGYETIADVSQIDYKSKVKPAFAQTYQDLDILEYFLQYGSVPSWSNVGSKLNLQEIYNELSSRQLAALQRMVERNISQDSFLQRLILQFSEEQIINLLEPISSDTVNFIQQTISALTIFERARPNVSRSISSSKSKEMVLKTALEYAFLRKKTNFVKQTFLQDTLENLAPALNSDENILLDELIAEQQNPNSNYKKEWGDELATVLETLQTKRESTQIRKETRLNEALEEANDIETQLKELAELLEIPDLSSSQREDIFQEIDKLQKQLNTLERKQISQLAELSAPAAQRLSLEWQNVQNLIENLQSQTQDLSEQAKEIAQDSPQAQLLQAQERIETALRSRLVELLDSIAKTLSQPKTIERTLKLQRLNKELIFVLNFLQDKQQNLNKQIDNLDKLLKDAKNSRQKQLIRQQRDGILASINALKEEIAELQPQQQSLQKTINELTRITAKDAESLENADNEAETNPEYRSKMDYLIFFLEYAAVPWWAEPYKNEKIENIFAELAQSQPQALRRSFARIGRNPAVWQRLVAQLSENTLQQLVDNLYPAQAQMVSQQLFIFDRILMSKVFKSLGETTEKEFRWAKIIETLLTRDNLNLQGFIQHVVKIMALDYNLSPSQLLGIIQNLEGNIPDSGLDNFAQTAQELDKDEELIAIEVDLKRQAARRHLDKAGIQLSDVEKISFFQQYISTGQLPQEALDAGINTVAKLEKLLYEQIDLNPQPTLGIIFELFKTAEYRSFVIRNFSENTYWELIQLISPAAILLAQSYLQTLSEALKDKNLFVEKQLIIRFAMEHINKPIESSNLTDFLLENISQDNNRKKIAIANEWKRKISALAPSKRDNSLLPQLIQAEIEMLQKTENITTVSQQIQDLRNEYNQIAAALNQTQQREAIEIIGVPQEVVTLAQLYTAIDNMKAQYEQVLNELATIDKSANPIDFLKLQTQQAQLLARIKLAQRKEPARLRDLRLRYQEAQKQLTQAQQQLQTIQAQQQANVLPEELKNSTEAPTLGLDLLQLGDLEQKASVLTALRLVGDKPDAFSPAQIQKLKLALERLVKQNTDKKAMDWEDISATAQLLSSQSDNAIVAQLLDLIPEQLQKSPNLPATTQKISQQLQSLLANYPQLLSIIDDLQIIQDNLHKNIRKMEISKLIADWQDAKRLQEQLMKLIEKDKNLVSNDPVLDAIIELDELQADIYTQIQREENRRRSAQLQQIQARIQQYQQQSQSIADVEQLEIFAAEIQTAEAEILSLLENFYTDNPIPEIAAELPAMRKNINVQFAQIQQLLIWRKNRLWQQLAQEQNQQIEEAQTTQKMLEDEQKEILAAAEKPTAEEIERAQAEEEAVQKQRETRRRTLAPKPIDEPLVVKNAGLVILQPFIPRYFDALGLVKNKFFVSQEAQFKAIHLLQYLATKQLETPENELVFNKILVGLPINTPVPLSVEISQEEIDFSESLLQGAIANWSRMKTMSPDALRSTFIIRNGTIKEEPDRWKLVVEKGGFDVLLRTISWGFTFVRFSWLEKSIFVEWNYM